MSWHIHRLWGLVCGYLEAIILLTTWSISLASLNWNGYVFLPLSQSSHCIQPFGRIERLWPGWALCSRVGSWQADHSGLSADSTLRSCGNKLLSWGEGLYMGSISKFIKVHSLSHLDSLLQNCFGNSSSWILVSLSVWESFRTRGGKKHNSDHCCRLNWHSSSPPQQSRPYFKLTSWHNVNPVFDQSTYSFNVVTEQGSMKVVPHESLNIFFAPGVYL